MTKRTIRYAPILALCACLVLAVGHFRGNSQVHAAAVMPAHLLVANQGSRTLSIIDPAADQQIAAVPVGGVTGHEVAASLDGRTAFVPIYGDSGVAKPGTDGRYMAVIDVASHKVTSTFDFGHGVRPHCAILDPVSKLLYVTTEIDQTITIIDPQTLKIVGTIPTGRLYSHMLAISHDGSRGYTANVKPGTVSVLDMKARKTLTVIPISAETQRISISNDDSMVFTSDQTKPQLAVVDTATNQVKTWVPLPSPGYGTASTRDGRWLLVAMRAAQQVAVVDLQKMQVARTIDVPADPQEVLMNPDGSEAYVSCNKKNQVAVIDLSQWKVKALIDAGDGADGLAWAK
jgi:YVTN family beta-propeller protein